MTRKEQNKIFDDQIESNVNQYKVDRLNAEISAFSSGDLNKYEFLKRIDLNYKPNALDKARFEFSPLGQTFNTGLDKNAQGYQEEGIIKLLKDIRGGLAGGIVRKVPRGSDDDDDDDDDDEQKRLSKLSGELRTNEDNEEFRNEPKEDKLDKYVQDTSSLEHNVNEEATLNKFKEMVRNKEDEINKTFKEKEDRLNKLNNNVKKINNYVKENNDKINNKEKEYNKLLLKYSEINRELNKTKDELYRARNDINKQKTIQERLNYQNNEAEELKRKLNEKKEDIDKLKYNIKNLENINKISNDKVFDVLNKFKNNMENKMSDLDKMVTSKADEWNTKLNKLNNDAKKIDNYIKKNNNIKKEHDDLLLRLNQLNEERNMLRNELKIVEDKLNKVSNDIDKKNLIMN